MTASTSELEDVDVTLMTASTCGTHAHVSPLRVTLNFDFGPLGNSKTNCYRKRDVALLTLTC